MFFFHYIVTTAMTTMVPCINIGRTEFLLYIIDCLLITCPPQYLQCPPMVRLLGTGLILLLLLPKSLIHSNQQLIISPVGLQHYQTEKRNRSMRFYRIYCICVLILPYQCVHTTRNPPTINNISSRFTTSPD